MNKVCRAVQGIAHAYKVGRYPRVSFAAKPWEFHRVVLSHFPESFR